MSVSLPGQPLDLNHDMTLSRKNSECTLRPPAILDEEKSTPLSLPTLGSLGATGKVASLSTCRLLAAHIGAALTLFLVTTDATIVSTSLPTIVGELQASQSQYTWVGVAFMLSQTACQPLYGQVSDLVGRKNLLWGSMLIFALGSLLCAVSQTITWLIAARGLAGVGGGGIVSCVWVLTSEIVPVNDRAKWSQALSITWSCSAIAGPLLGGIFSGSSSSNLSWRWSFWINLPVCAFAFVILWLSLRDIHFPRPAKSSWGSLGRRFDFGGLVLFMTGSICINLGFNFATSQGWTSPLTLVLITLGIAVLALGGVHETRTKRDALFPPDSFRSPNTVMILIITFMHQFAFCAGTYYLALYFQAVNGMTPFQAGMRMLPYSLGSCLASMPAAWFIGLWQRRNQNTSGQKWVVCIGLAVATIGFGLMNLLHAQSSNILQTIFPLIAGVGVGMLFHAPYQIFLRALKPEELATGTSAMFLVRFTGATVGLSVGGAIFYGGIRDRLPATLGLTGPGSSIDYGVLKFLQPAELRLEVLGVVSSSLRRIWTVCAPCLGIALLLSLFLAVVELEQPQTESMTSTITDSTSEKVSKS